MRKLITDLEMPNLNGLELTRRVREVRHCKPRSTEAGWRPDCWATIAESIGDATLPFYCENVMKVASSPGS